MAEAFGFITTINVVVRRAPADRHRDPEHRRTRAPRRRRRRRPYRNPGYVLNWKRYWATVRTCKLYDYANHQWLDFKGRVTAAPLFPEAAPAAG
jgi:hypothetical protein